MLKRNQLICYDHEKLKHDRDIYTFNSPSWIDHLICDTEFMNNIFDFKINKDHRNTSDHYSITFNIKMNLQNRQFKKIENKKSTKPLIKPLDWSDESLIQAYKKHFEERLIKNKITGIEPDVNLDQNTLNNEYNSIVTAIIEAYNESCENKNKSKGNIHTKYKPWWNDELQQLNEQAKIEYNEYKKTSQEKKKEAFDKYNSTKNFFAENKDYINFNKSTIKPKI